MAHAVGVYEAKNHLPELLRSVMAGARIDITKHGMPIATLVPYQAPANQVAEAVKALQSMSKRISLKGIKIKALIEEGRR